MAGKCSICSHKSRAKIDKSLAVDGASLRDIAGQFRVSKSALQRHMENGHIADKMVTAKRVIETREIDQFQAEHQALVQDLIEQKAAAKKEGDRKLELEVTDRLIKMHDINGKGSGVYREKVEHSGNVESMMSDEEVERRAREILERRSNK